MNEQQELKLIALRKKYALSAESQFDIGQLETDLTKAIDEKRMVDNPIFQAIVKDAEKKIEDINTLLMTDRKLTTEQRVDLFNQKDLWKFNFDRFGLHVQDRAIKQLEQVIEEKLNQ